VIHVPDLLSLPTFIDNDVFRVAVESPRGSSLKLKYDAELQVITLSRPLIVGLTYLYDWGFVPSTKAADGDPLDAVVMWDGVSYPGVILPWSLASARALWLFEEFCWRRLPMKTFFK
jgi:inorganic pyrophosphatase